MTNSLGSVRRVWMPYALARLADGSYLPVNRQYKPLGSTTSARVNYDDAPGARIRLTPALARTLCVNGRGDLAEEFIYLYNDASAPDRSAANWQTYSARLSALAKAKLAGTG